MNGFPGFPPELFTFFEGMKDNSKAYCEANYKLWVGG